MISMNEYNIGYLDGRNHALELTTRFVSSRMQEGAPERKAQTATSILQVLSDRSMLSAALTLASSITMMKTSALLAKPSIHAQNVFR